MSVLGARDGNLATRRGTRSRSRLFMVALVVAAAATLVGGNGAQGQEVLLGTAQRFAVLAASTITNANATTIHGDVGLYPGTAVTGFETVTQTGSLYVAPAGEALQGQADALTAYTNLRGRPCPNDLTGRDLGTVSSLANPLVPGVYCFSSSAQLTGTLYLAGGGPYVFQIGTTLTTAPNSSVVVVAPTQQGGCDIFWAVGSSATLDTGTQFVGTIIAEQSISALSGAVIRGRLIALEAAVTMDNNTITRPICATTTTTTAPPGATTTTPLPVTTITIPGTTTAIPGITTTTGLQGTTTTTTLQDGSGPGPTTTVVQGATTTTTGQATTTTAGAAATTTTVGSGTPATTAPGGGTGSGPRADSLAAAAGSGQALARTGATPLQPMAVAGLLAVILGGAMVLIPAPSEKGRRRPRSQARFPA